MSPSERRRQRLEAEHYAAIQLPARDPDPRCRRSVAAPLNWVRWSIALAVLTCIAALVA